MGNINRTLFVVLTCDKYVETRVKNIKETWGSNSNVVYLSDNTHMGGVVGYSTPQTYAGIQDKYRCFFRNYSFDEYDYYFFVDDDTFVNLDFYDSYLLPQMENFCFCRYGYLGVHGEDLSGKWTGYNFNTISGIDTHMPLYYPGGGAGFILDKSGINKIKDRLNALYESDIPRSGHSDVTVGFWIRMCGLELINSELLNYTNPEDFSHNEDKIKSNITYHYVTMDRMIELNKICNNDLYSNAIEE